MADYPDPDDFLRAVMEFTQWQNEEYNKLVKEARRAIEQRERIKLYKQADRILIQEAMIVPLTYGRECLLVKPWVKKYPISALKYWFWKDVVIEPH